MAYAKEKGERWSALRKLCHVEICKSPLDSIKYCSKEDSRIRGPYEKGTRPTWNIKGQKLKNMELLKLSPEEALENDKINWKDYPLFKKVKQQYSLANAQAHQSLSSIQDSRERVRGLWYCGPPRTGKSTAAREKKPYIKMLNKWWDDYQGEEIVLLEDVDKSQGSWLGQFMKIWADVWNFRAEVKGGSMMIGPFKEFIVTSNYRPEDIWEDQNMLAPILARFKIIEFN